MKFEHVFVEKQLRNDPYAKALLQKLKHLPVTEIESYDSTWGKVRVPYLDKRKGLKVFIAKKKGQLIKQTPPAYGTSDGIHYYFIHAYNCPYECQYCYLQGYFQTPHLVFFVNHDEILDEMQKVVDQEKSQQNIWFHAGEFSDSLALSHLTNELPTYWKFFLKNPQSFLEIRSKSANISALLELPSAPNIICSFSFSGPDQIQRYEKGTAPFKARLSSLEKLAKMGHSIAIHFDPLVYQEHWREDFTKALNALATRGLVSKIRYCSLGVIRFPQDIAQQVEKNYSDSDLFNSPMETSSSGMKRYPYPLRRAFLREIYQLCLSSGFQERQLYFCMED